MKREYGHTCPSCLKKEPGIKLTVDHVIPITKGGNDYISNIQPLCKSCNSKKKNHFSKRYQLPNIIFSTIT